MSAMLPPDSPDDPAGLEGYPAHPRKHPALPDRQPSDPIQPRSIRIAVRLMWFGAALGLVSVAITFARIDSVKGDIRKRLSDGNRAYSQSAVDLLLALVIVSLVIGAALAVAVWLWMAWKNGQGRPWARIVASTMGGFVILSEPFEFAVRRPSALSATFSVIDIVLVSSILVLLWRGESSEFYSASFLLEAQKRASS